MAPPLYYMGMDVDWPFQSYFLGSEINYKCPIYLATWDEALTGEEKKMQIGDDCFYNTCEYPYFFRANVSMHMG